MSSETKALANLNSETFPGAWAFVGISMGAIVIRWGPYAPEEAGKFIERVLELDPDRGVPFFVGLQCDPVDDPIEMLKELGFFAPAEPAAEGEPGNAD